VDHAPAVPAFGRALIVQMPLALCHVVDFVLCLYIISSISGIVSSNTIFGK
jgi:hypothetical protein